MFTPGQRSPGAPAGAPSWAANHPSRRRTTRKRGIKERNREREVVIREEQVKGEGCPYLNARWIFIICQGPLDDCMHRTLGVYDVICFLTWMQGLCDSGQNMNNDNDLTTMPKCQHCQTKYKTLPACLWVLDHWSDETGNWGVLTGLGE